MAGKKEKTGVYERTPETKKKMSLASKKRWQNPEYRENFIGFTGKHHSPETIKKISGEKNGSWKGDNVGYDALHRWVRRHKFKPQFCEDCNEFPPVDVGNISGLYKRDINDYKWLCRKCHFKIHYPDGRMGKNLHKLIGVLGKKSKGV